MSQLLEIITYTDVDVKAAVKANKHNKASKFISYEIKCNDVNYELLDQVQRDYFCTEYSAHLDEFLGIDSSDVKPDIKLRSKVLSFGGFQLDAPLAMKETNKLNKRGQFWIGNNAKLIGGEPGQCHWNSAQMWIENKGNRSKEIKLVTGYALTSDGIWRKHSWCILKDSSSRDEQIIETTMERLAYYGFVMTEAEAKQFYWSSC